MSHRRIQFILALGLLALLRTTALAGEKPSEQQLKAAFLLNFARFVEWPAAAYANASSPLVIGVLGHDQFEGILEQTVQGQQINGRPILIRRPTDENALRSCHLLFIPAAENQKTDRILAAIRGYPVLTVGEADGFLVRGGMINFVVQNSHIRFEINAEIAAQAGLRVSSKLLQLAANGASRAAQEK